ncbi:MAG: hydrogenase maturation protease [Verrucomicrobiae bacterium]|nr:hydrogenase maturation protease [Verrucomicrobiae bacterium]
MNLTRLHLLLGLGNELLRDDSVGLHAVRALRPRLDGRFDWDVAENMEGGLAMLDAWAGHEDVVLVDAVRTGRRPVGWVHLWSGDDLPRLVRGSLHAMGVGEVLALGRLLGMRMPRWLTVLGVEVLDAETLDTELTEELRRAFPLVVERVWTVIGERSIPPRATLRRELPWQPAARGAWADGGASCVIR